ncbi:MAG: ABC transporter ATP-binding protein [Chloroflexota bacterium]
MQPGCKSKHGRKFFSYYKPYLKLFFGDVACALIVSGTALLLPLCANYITKNILANHAPDALWRIYGIGALMIALLLVHTLCNMFVDYQGHIMGALMERDMRRELFDHYQRLSFSFFDEQKTGQLMTRLTNDSFNMSELFHHGPEDIVISLLNFTGAFIIMLTINAKLAVIVFLFLPVMVVYVAYFNKRSRSARLKYHARIGDINAQAEDTLAGIRVVKSFTNEEIERDKFATTNDRFVDSRRDVYRNEANFSAGMTASTQLLVIAVVVFGSIAILDVALSLPDLITFLLYVTILVEPIQRFSNFTRLYQDGIAGFDRFMDAMEVKPDIEDSPNAISFTEVQGNIEFRDVSFKYKEEHDYVLKNISLNIKAGEYIALVGSSGVGKTTLCSLIPRFYDINGGCILLDGIDLRDISLRSLRRNIGVVQQDVYLFSGTVADNIRYGKLSASRDEVIEAARKANAHSFIEQLPAGYDTDIGQRGVKLSGGQKQRLSIARVFLKNPPILIFDEATSSLDNESERAVQESLEKLANHRTTLVIAHRLSTIRNAQRIVVLTENGIEEQGTHEELIAMDRTYANLYNVQARI